MFVSILTDSFSAVRRDVQSQTNDYEIVDFMIGRLKKWTGLGTQPSTTIDPNVNKTLDGYANDDEEDDEDKFDEAINPNMAMFPSRIDKLLNSLSAIYQENDSLAGLPKPWMKQPYQAPPRCDQLSFRPPSAARDRFRPPSTSQDGSRPTSAVRFRPPSSSQDGSRPTSAVRDHSRPTSGAQKRRSSLSKVETS
ncbi:uncharacterized protein LOC131938745 [Physella acuta]|uniref:uncharacterized protein LOC131938745 n=1 Tax=Physella acuta TaxID=109671 RepID=UPI0027DB5015|nr:uncharacterized protein LOC131938745 [Physella acuta]